MLPHGAARLPKPRLSVSGLMCYPAFPLVFQDAWCVNLCNAEQLVGVVGEAAMHAPNQAQENVNATGKTNIELWLRIPHARLNRGHA